MTSGLFVVLVSLYSTTAIAQDVERHTVTSDHKPNAQTLECLEAPTRDCALTSALQTVIKEDFGMERAKVLIGVARAMIETGKNEQAQKTLMLALDEARSVNLSLIVQEKIKTIAPLLAEAGDVAGALALTEEVKIESVKDNIYIAIAEAAYKNGDVAGGKFSLKHVSNQGRAFWQELSLLTITPRDHLAGVSLAELEQKVKEVEVPSYRYRGYVQLAIIADRMRNAGDRSAYLSVADEIFSSVVGIQSRADAVAYRARNMFDAGMAPVFVNASYELALLHGGRLRGNNEQAAFADKVGPIEAANGKLHEALKRLDYFNDLDEKTKYLASLKTSRGSGILAAEVRETLDKIDQTKGAYERDLMRLTLLEGAFSNGDLPLARHIVTAMEDDDNQALALALIAPMLD